MTLPYIKGAKGKSGRYYYYYRRKGRMIALKDAQGVPVTPSQPQAFMEAYDRAHALFDGRTAQSKAQIGTIGALILDYQASAKFQNLRDTTKKTYSELLSVLARQWRDIPTSAIQPRDVALLQDRFANTPRTADALVQRLRTLFDLAVRQGLISINPAAGIKPQHKHKPHPTWTHDEITSFTNEAKPHLGRVILWLWRTGLRISDCLSISPQMIQDGVLHITSSKNGVKLAIPLHSDLLEDMRKNPVGVRHVLVNSKGAKWTRSGFSASFRKEMKRLEMEVKALHGLRRAFVVTALEAGVSLEAIGSMTDQSPATVRYYAADHDRAKLAKKAMARIDK